MLSPSQYRPVAEEDPEDADDERSISELEDEQLQRRASYQRRHPGAPTFPGQDIRPTSQKELAGWYSYAWASEVYVVCGIGSFVPVTLEQLARENGVLFVDKTTPCAASTVAALGEKGSQCVVNLFGWWVNTASYAMYTFSISVFIQSLIIISMSGAADHGNYRKLLLLAFAYMGSIATMMFITVSPNVYLFSALWAIISNVGFGASFVLLNAFLPVLVRQHPSTNTSIMERRPSTTLDAAINGERSHLLSSPPRTPLPAGLDAESSPQNSAELRLSTRISSYGIAIGYCASVILQIIAVCLVVYTGSTTWSLRLVMFCIGLWWFVFTIPTALWIRPRPGPPLPKMPRAPGSSSRNRERTLWTYIAYSWRGLWKTIKRARQLKDVMLFLGAWFLVSDGVATVSGTAVLFAKTNLHMKPAALALISVITMVFGVVGAFAWSRISPIFKLTPSQTILCCMCVFEIIPLYGLLGFIPFIQRIGIGGLTQPWEMYVLGAVYGFVLGGISGYCRSVFGELIPPGSEAAFYALYAITDKGSSIFGPSIVGILTDKYGDIRVAFWFLAVLLALPIPLIAMVDLRRGKEEGRRLAEEELSGSSSGSIGGGSSNSSERGGDPNAV